jgi:hypothetical protein
MHDHLAQPPGPALCPVNALVLSMAEIWVLAEGCVYAAHACYAQPVYAAVPWSALRCADPCGQATMQMPSGCTDVS